MTNVFSSSVQGQSRVTCFSPSLNSVDPEVAVPVWGGAAFGTQGVRPSHHTVYNFEVEGTHTYIADGIRVHNTSALSFFDPDQNGTLTGVIQDDDGRIVGWRSQTPDGGNWETRTRNIDPAGNTVEVTKTYTLGDFNTDGTPKLDSNDNPPRFYLQQVSTHEIIDGEQVLTDVRLVEGVDYRLFGDEVGGGVANALTPFVLSAIGAESVFEKLAAGTLLDAVIQNIAEGGFNALHQSFLDADTNGQIASELITDAWSDFGVDLATSGIETTTSLVSQFLRAELYAALDVDSLGEEFIASVVLEGVEHVIDLGIDQFLDITLGSDSVIAQAFDAGSADFLSAANLGQLALNLILNDILPGAETQEGAIAGALTQAIASSLIAIPAPIPHLIVVQLVVLAVTQIVDAIFGGDPEAYANLSFDPETGRWVIDSVYEDDGGNIPLAEGLGQAVSDSIAEFTTLMQSTDVAFSDGYGIRIGHFNEHLRNGNGQNYSQSSTVVYSSVVAALQELTATDGDLKVLRSLNLENISEDIAGLDETAAYSLLYSRLKLASDYHYYLNNTEFVNQLIVNAPESAVAKAWVITILSAAEAGLDDSYEFTGDDSDNLVLTADGVDTVSGGAGNDELRTYGEQDIIFGGAGNDLISGGVGADAIDGGTGTDTITFDDSGVGVSLDLHQGVGFVGDAEGDTYTNVEDIRGSNFADTIVGDNANNLIEGLGSSDELYGRGGNDTLHGNSGNDTIFGDLGDDLSVSGHDVIYGGEGDDVLHGGEGRDTVNGGEGFDLASYRFSSTGVVASLISEVTKVNGDIETFTNIEGLVGSSFNDHLFGNSAVNTLEGLAGDDLLIGGEGSDTYFYSFGDGNDEIQESDFDLTTVDRLVFRDLSVDDVSFSITNTKDLIATTASGDRITVTEQFSSTRFNAVEEVEFSGGTILNGKSIRDKAVSDQKEHGAGTVFGTEFEETYVHNLGDGSYTIYDDDDNGRTDRLVLNDVNAEDVQFASSDDEDLIITFQNGERVTISDHFAESRRGSIEEIEFSDGSVLGAAEIRAKSIKDQKDQGSGTVIGSDFSEHYEHALGDGSYTIYDFDNDHRTDRLIFSDVNVEDVKFSSNSDEDLVIRLSNGERVTISDHFSESRNYSIEEIEFQNGMVLDLEAIGAKSVNDQQAAGGATSIGTDFSETYTHALGDGTYTILDDDNDSRTDRLVFVDVNSEDVRFVSSATDDLVVVLPNGERVTVTDHFSENRRYAIEEVEFADGLVLFAEDIRNKSVEDQKSIGAGTVFGTDFAEVYTHNLGDGSYTIVDNDNNHRTDRLIFEDVTEDDVTFASNDGEDLIITLQNGERVTVEDHFRENQDQSIEEIEFSDGTVLTHSEIREKSVNDQKLVGGGLIVGTDFAETYTHALGDGSYRIVDFDNNRRPDRFVFTDVQPDDVDFVRDGDDLRIFVSGRDQVVIERQLGTNDDYYIEEFEFADGTLWSQAEVSAQVVEASDYPRFIIGTEQPENYFYNLGDGSLAIFDLDPGVNNGADQLTLSDVNLADVTFSRSGDDLIVNLPNGESISLVDQLSGSSVRFIEALTFADGTSLNQFEMRERLFSDAKATGLVVGTEFADAYSHKTGDGSYSIEDFDSGTFGGDDVLTFEDATSEAVTFGRSGEDLTITLSNGETVTLVDHLFSSRSAIEELSFSDGITLNRGEIRDRLVSDLKSTGVVNGTANVENYVHKSGDGSYVISDINAGINNGNDTLTFTDLNHDDVRLSRDGVNLVFNLPNGETVVLAQQLESSTIYAIELVTFADGVTYNSAGLRARLAEETKPDGFVVGTARSEAYVHTSGDGSYSITDVDDFLITDVDTLTFSDVDFEDVVLSRSANDLIFTLPNDEQITIAHQLDGSRVSSIEQFVFSDGTVVSQEEIRDRLVSDMKELGMVIGTENVEAYVHTAGDGSYVISDFDSGVHGGSDTLTFTDFNFEDITLSRSANNLVVALPNGEILTIVNQLDGGRTSSIETFAFADGMTLDQSEIRDRLVSDLKASGFVTGTENVEQYVHTSGDGSYVITDFDTGAHGGDDHLRFTDVSFEDVTLSRSADDLIISLPNGEQVTIANQLSLSSSNFVELFSFADGRTLSSADIRNELVESLQDQGVVVGTENVENYVHSLGDGSYVISDRGALHFDPEDTLTFIDVNASDVLFTRFESDLIVQLPNEERVTIQDYLGSGGRSFKIERIIFADGEEFTPTEVTDRLTQDMRSVGQLLGSAAADVFTHTLGDGSYSISDFGSIESSVVDTLNFVDATLSDVTVSRNINDVLLSFSNGETVTLTEQLNQSVGSAIEQFVFSDGTSISQSGLLDILNETMRATGTVVGSLVADVYEHTSGFGSYAINDQGSESADVVDSLSFTDVSLSDVSVSRVASDLIFDLVNGERVTLVGQLAETTENVIEHFSFADGNELDQVELLDLLNQSMRAAGSVIGSSFGDDYVHQLGDGSYTISEYASNAVGVLDTLTFSDIDEEDVSLSQIVNDLVISLSNGETITVLGQLNDAVDTSIERFVFADGTILDQSAIEVRLAQAAEPDSDAPSMTYNDVIGTDGDDRNDFRLVGTEEADRIYDGAGLDELEGRGGADIFVLSLDGDREEIRDFELGVDLIDVSAWGATDFSEFTITQDNSHVRLVHGSEVLTIRSTLVSDLSAGTFVFAEQTGDTNSGGDSSGDVGAGGTGVAYNEIIGTDADDRDGTRLVGTDGADRIFDGAGRDELQGGADADIFVFAADGEFDEIRDFQAGEDQIDLSAWGVTSYADLNLLQDNSHVRLTYQGEILEIKSTLLSEVDAETFIFAEEASGTSSDSGSSGETSSSDVNVTYNEIIGTDADDRDGTRLVGTDGADRIYDGAGSDELQGGAGADIFVFAADGEFDEIRDFQVGEDLIDVSAWGASSFADLTLIQDNSHVRLTYEGEILEIKSTSLDDLQQDQILVV